jgi:hypothetical protein
VSAHGRIGSVSPQRDTDAVPNCPGGHIVHRSDYTLAGCTELEDGGDCPGLDETHEGDPVQCIDEWDHCDYCGIVA